LGSGGSSYSETVNELLVRFLLEGSGEIAFEQQAGDPDYRIINDGGLAATVECVTLRQKEDWSDVARRRGSVVDYLNKNIPLTRWFVELDELPSEPVNFPLKRLADKIRLFLKDLDSRYPSDDGRVDVPHLIPFNEGPGVTITASPCLDTGDGGRIMTGGGIGGEIDSAARLADSLGAKATKGRGQYSLSEKPFAIVVIANDSFLDRGSVLDALYGRNTIYSDKTARRSLSGLYVKNGAAYNHHVSSVFIVEQWSLADPKSAQVCRYDNPMATNTFPNIIPFAARHGGGAVNGQVAVDWVLDAGIVQ
jgi:hypothetical protein